MTTRFDTLTNAEIVQRLIDNATVPYTVPEIVRRANNFAGSSLAVTSSSAERLRHGLEIVMALHFPVQS